jgi:hypothetical protein
MDPFSQRTAGATLLAFAVVATALTEAGAFRPRLTARLTAAACLMVSSFIANTGSPERLWVELLGLITGATLIALSIRRGTFVYMATGVALLFLNLLIAVVRRVNDPTGVAAALVLLGALLIGAVVVLSRIRPWEGRRAAG